MSKIFGIGLPKTGTVSLTGALTILGYKAIHNDIGLVNANDYDAMTDLPIAYAFRLLDELNSGSKFIYTVRAMEPWLESCSKHWNSDFRRSEEDTDPEVVALHKRVFGVYNYDRQAFIDTYERHDKTVREHFKNRPADLLIVDICKSPGWEEICAFLDKPIPDVDFPHLNTRREKRAYNDRRRLWRSMRPFIPKPIRSVLKPLIVRKPYTYGG